MFHPFSQLTVSFLCGHLWLLTLSRFCLPCLYIHRISFGDTKADIQLVEFHFILKSLFGSSFIMFASLIHFLCFFNQYVMFVQNYTSNIKMCVVRNHRENTLFLKFLRIGFSMFFTLCVFLFVYVIT